MSWIPLAAMLFRDSYMFSFYLYIFQSMSHVWDFHSISYFLHQNQYTSSVQIPRKKNKLSHYGIEITGILVVFDDCSINRFVWKSDGNCQSAFVWLVLSGIPIWADTSWLHCSLWVSLYFINYIHNRNLVSSSSVNDGPLFF